MLEEEKGTETNHCSLKMAQNRRRDPERPRKNDRKGGCGWGLDRRQLKCNSRLLCGRESLCQTLGDFKVLLAGERNVAGERQREALSVTAKSAKEKNNAGRAHC